MKEEDKDEDEEEEEDGEMRVCLATVKIWIPHMRKFVLETEILGSCKKQIRRFVLIKIKELNVIVSHVRLLK